LTAVEDLIEAGKQVRFAEVGLFAARLTVHKRTISALGSFGNSVLSLLYFFEAARRNVVYVFCSVWAQPRPANKHRMLNAG
jgi:hypothetical protein